MKRSIPISRRLLSHGAWAISGKAVTAVAALTVNVLLARLLAPNEMGVYFLILSLVNIAALIAQLGLNQTAVRLLAESLSQGMPGRAHAIVRTVFLYAVIGTVLVMGILVLGGGSWIAYRLFKSPLMAGMIGFAALWVAVLAFQNLLAETFRGFHDIRLATIFGGVITGGLSAALFSLLWIVQGRARLEEVLILSIVSGTVNGLVAGFFIFGKLRALKLDERFRGNRILGIALPLLLNNLTSVLLTQSDIWVLGAFRPHDEVALYGATARFMVLIEMPLFIVNAVIPPLVTQLFVQGKKEELQSTLQTTASMAAIPAFFVTLGFIFLGNPILGMVYGDYYRGGSTILAVLSLGQLVNVLTGSCGLTLIMTGHQVTLMKITILTGILMVLGAIWFVKDYGPLGVAGVASSAMVLQNLLMWFFAKRQVGVWTHARFMTPTMVKSFLSHEVSRQDY